MDLGFVILVFAICVPFVILAFGLSWTAKKQKAEQLQTLLKRVGVEVAEQKKINRNLSEYKNFKIYLGLMTWFKKAGINNKKIIYQLLALQLILLIVSSYLWLTRMGSMDSKTILVTLIIPLMPFMYVMFKRTKRQNKMKKQFPEMLDALVRALQSGYGIDGGLSMIANEFPEPLGQEMKEVTRQLSLGINMRDILREFQSRIDLQEGQFFVVTLIIQRETGGQLAAILSELSRLMRRRDVFQAKLQTLTAESRFTAMFIGSAPIGYLSYKYLFDRDSMNFFLTDPTGQKMLFVSIALILTGTVILKQMLKMRF